MLSPIHAGGRGERVGIMPLLSRGAGRIGSILPVDQVVMQPEGMSTSPTGMLTGIRSWLSLFQSTIVRRSYRSRSFIRGKAYLDISRLFVQNSINRSAVRLKSNRSSKNWFESRLSVGGHIVWASRVGR